MKTADRRGFALLIVVLLMAVGTALMVAAMDGSLAEAETVSAEALQRRAMVGAESGAWTAFRGLNAAALRHAPVGPVAAGSRTTGDMTLITTVEKVDTLFVWIVATATIQRPATVARHRIGLSAIIPDDTADMALHLVPDRAWAELF